MRSTTTALLTAVLLVVATVAVPATVVGQSNATASPTPTETPTTTPAANETDNASAGALLQGVVGVQEAEIDGEIRSRSFGIQVARAASDEAKADVVASETDDVQERLTELEERKERLQQARNASNISTGQYRAEMAKLAVETETVQSLANESANVSERLPADVLERKGINVTAIRTLSDRAEELSGPEVSRIARSIAGPSVGEDIGAARERRGAPDNETRTGPDRTNRTATAGDDRAGEGNQTRDGSQARDGNQTRNGSTSGSRTVTPTSTPDGTETDTANGTSSGSDRGARTQEGA